MQTHSRFNRTQNHQALHRRGEFIRPAPNLRPPRSCDKQQPLKTRRSGLVRDADIQTLQSHSKHQPLHRRGEFIRLAPSRPATTKLRRTTPVGADSSAIQTHSRHSIVLKPIRHCRFTWHRTTRHLNGYDKPRGPCLGAYRAKRRHRPFRNKPSDDKTCRSELARHQQ